MDRLQRSLLTFMVATAAAPGLVGGRLLAMVAFAHDVGMGPVNMGTLLATLVCAGACGHVWQRPTRSLRAWAGLCVVVTFLGGAAFWICGAMADNQFALSRVPLVLLAGGLFAGPLLAVVALLQALVFVGAIRFSGASSGTTIRTSRFLISALALALFNGLVLVAEVQLAPAGWLERPNEL